VSFKLNTDEHGDLIRWLDAQDNRSGAIRAAIKAAMHGLTLGDVYAKLGEIERKLETGVMIAGGAPEVGEPPEAAAALDALASL